MQLLQACTFTVFRAPHQIVASGLSILSGAETD